MAIGRIATPAEAEAAIADGAGDLVGLTRALIADADWPNKAREGRVDDIRPSSYDNFAWGEIHVGKPLAEIHNPQLGTKGESGWRPTRARQKTRVVVVGAGPAGLQAARIAAAARARRDAARRVAATRRQAALGSGAARPRRIPQRARLDGAAAARRRREARARRHGDARTTCSRSSPTASSSRPARILRRAGGFRRRGSVRARLGRPSDKRPLATAPPCCSTWTTAPRPTRWRTRSRSATRKLVLLTPRTQLARNVNYCSAIGVHRRLYEANAEIVMAAEPVALRDGVLTWRNVFTGGRRTSPTSRCFSGRRRASPTMRSPQPLRAGRHRYAARRRLHGAAQSASARSTKAKPPRWRLSPLA